MAKLQAREIKVQGKTSSGVDFCATLAIPIGENETEADVLAEVCDLMRSRGLCELIAQVVARGFLDITEGAESVFCRE